MNNKKVLFLTSLLAITALVGCDSKNKGGMILPEGSEPEVYENNGVAYPDELRVNHRVAAMLVGDTFQLEATEQFGYDAKNIKYEIANPAIASVDENGLITGLTAGETEILVSDKNNPEFKRTVPVSIYPSRTSSQISTVTADLKTYETISLDGSSLYPISINIIFGNASSFFICGYSCGSIIFEEVVNYE